MITMRVLLALYRALLAKRYRVRITGVELLQDASTKLLLPNHVALVDPQIIFAYLGKYTTLHPLVMDAFFSAPGLHRLFKIIGAIPIASTEGGNLTSSAIDHACASIDAALGEGKNVVIYPAGGLKTQATESIIGKKVAYTVLRALPEKTRVILVKTTGLRGSASSKAWIGKTPSLLRFLLRGCGILLANGWFRAPKREVVISLHDVTDEIGVHVEAGLDTCNQRLESQYNSDGPEPLFYTPSFFYYNDTKDKKLPEIIGSHASLTANVDHSQAQYPQDVIDAIYAKARALKPDYTGPMSLQTNIVLDMYCDSLDAAELKSWVQTTYSHASNPPLLDLKCLGDYVAMAVGKSKHEEKLPSCAWDHAWTHTPLHHVTQGWKETDSIPEIMIRTFSRGRRQSFCYDTMRGVQSRRSYMIKVYLISQYIKKYDGEYIGIMLPAVSATSMLITATYLAGKIPVMLNRTQGAYAFNHCAAYKKLPAILTSQTFYAKIAAPHYDKHPIVFLETLLKDISLWDKLRAIWCAWWGPLPKQTEEAVILFTSGSEALPKAVSITHQNIIQNIKGSLEVLEVTQDDIILGFLPPFHSFGFTVNTILPLLTGLRVVYSPDPNDSKTLAHLVEHTKITGITSTPTFLKKLLHNAANYDLSSLSFVISGAEKCPADLFDTLHARAPHAAILEGYGITECSPVITVNPAVGSKQGSVGLPIHGLTLEILDLETMQPVGIGEEGMIYVSGPSVFSGYLDATLADPFILIHGDKFYRTGDMGKRDADGFLFITGRLKRFVKIAGEMVSLPYVEEVVLRGFGSDEAVNVAVEAQEYDGGATIVLFTTDRTLSLVGVNNYLHHEGVSRLIHIAKIDYVDALPLLGSGKIDYKALKSRIVEVR